MTEERFTISIVDVDEQDSKTFIDFEISDEFQEWFVRKHCPSSKFNEFTFKGWMRSTLQRALITLDKGSYQRIFSRMNGDRQGVCNPQKGDVVVFFTNGYRTRIISSITKQGIELEALFEGDSYRRINHGDIFEITRPQP